MLGLGTLVGSSPNRAAAQEGGVTVRAEERPEVQGGPMLYSPRWQGLWALSDTSNAATLFILLVRMTILRPGDPHSK